jgi:hypothetical protein
VAPGRSTPDRGAWSGRVWVTVTSGTRRVDLALPSAVCVADLAPELARSVSVLDSAVHGGVHVLARDGRELTPGLGLAAQGVEHGDVLTIAAGSLGDPPCAYDDLPEAVADLVAGDVAPWSPGAGRRTAHVAAAALLLTGAAGLVNQHSRVGVGPTAVAAAAVLLLTAVLFARVRGDAIVAAVTANLGCVYAAVAGLCWGWGDRSVGVCVACAGALLMGAGLAASLGLVIGRLSLMPAALTGAVAVVTGALTSTSTLDPAILPTCLLALVVIVSSVFPGLALSASGTGRHVLAGTEAGPRPSAIDQRRLAADVRLAREILVSSSATIGLLIPALAPVAVTCGPFGFAVPVLGCAVVMLRTRRYRAALDVSIGVSSGLAGLISTGATILWLDDSRAFVVALAAVAAGVLLSWQSLAARGDRVRYGLLGDRLGDWVETTALVALLPALVLAVSIEKL